MEFLNRRWVDYMLAGFLFVFVVCNVLVELPVCFGEEVSPESPNPITRAGYYWGLSADKIWIVQPKWSRVAVCYHSLGFGPLYLTLALGFLFRWTWIKQLAPVVGAAKLYAGAYYMTMNLTDAENSPAVPWLFVAQSSSYMVIPLLLILRMWNVDQPFKTTTTKPKKK